MLDIRENLEKSKEIAKHLGEEEAIAAEQDGFCRRAIHAYNEEQPAVLKKVEDQVWDLVTENEKVRRDQRATRRAIIIILSVLLLALAAGLVALIMNRGSDRIIIKKQFVWQKSCGIACYDAVGSGGMAEIDMFECNDIAGQEARMKTMIASGTADKKELEYWSPAERLLALSDMKSYLSCKK